MSEWISVEDRLPEMGEVYLVVMEGRVYSRLYDNFFSNVMMEKVTHWMPLPEPPQSS